MNEKNVFVFLGRFQPFHNGHLKAIRYLTKKFNCPCIISLIFAEKKKNVNPFTIELLKNELNEIKINESKIVKDFIICSVGFIPDIIKKIQDDGYNVVGVGCGEDRIDGYKMQIDNMLNGKYNVKVDSNFKILKTKRYNSATEIRDAIKNDDKNIFNKLMPNYTYHLYNKFKEQLCNI